MKPEAILASFLNLLMLVVSDSLLKCRSLLLFCILYKYFISYLLYITAVQNNLFSKGVLKAGIPCQSFRVVSRKSPKSIIDSRQRASIVKFLELEISEAERAI